MLRRGRGRRSRSITRYGISSRSSLAASTRTTCGERVALARDLAQEPLRPLRIAELALREQLHRRDAPVCDVARLVDLAHAAAADHVAEPKPAERVIGEATGPRRSRARDRDRARASASSASRCAASVIAFCIFAIASRDALCEPRPSRNAPRSRAESARGRGSGSRSPACGLVDQPRIVDAPAMNSDANATCPIAFIR